MSVWLPSVQQVLRLYEKLIARTGGSDGVRSLPLIESALNRAAASFGGVDVWPGIEEKAAAVGWCKIMALWTEISASAWRRCC